MNFSMEVVIEKFIKAFKLSTRYHSREEAEVIKKFTKEAIHIRNILYSLTPSNFEELSTWLFKTSPTERDFLYDLTFRFHSLLGPDPVFYKGLVESLANAGCADFSDDMVIQTYIGVPNDIQQRLPNITELRNMLYANKWLVTLLVLRLSAPISSELN